MPGHGAVSSTSFTNAPLVSLQTSTRETSQKGSVKGIKAIRTNGPLPNNAMMGTRQNETEVDELSVTLHLNGFTWCSSSIHKYGFNIINSELGKLSSRSPPKPPMVVSGVVAKVERDFPTAAVKHTHEKPLPTNDPRSSHHTSKPAVIQQPRK